MYEIRHNENYPFVMLDKRVFGGHLSAKAIGILGYLLSHSDGWQLYEAEVASHFTDGLASIRSGIKELIEAGYVKRFRKKDRNGRFLVYDYTVYSTPPSVFDFDVEEDTSDLFSDVLFRLVEKDIMESGYYDA